MQTLLIASVASAVTSYLVSRIWGAGTLIGAAATPIFVALVAESLRKPVETVSATAKRVPVVQRSPMVRERGRGAPDAPTHVAARASEHPTRVVRTPREPLAARVPGEPRPRQRRVAEPPPLDPGFVAAVEADEIERAARRSGPRWGLVLATGAAAFAIVVGVYTIPDLVAGKSITGSGRATTFFGGHSSSAKPKSVTKTVTETAPPTVTKTAPAVTTTVPAPTSTATTPTTPAPTTTTAPPTTTTAAPAPVVPAPTTSAPPADGGATTPVTP